MPYTAPPDPGPREATAHEIVAFLFDPDLPRSWRLPSTLPATSWESATDRPAWITAALAHPHAGLRELCLTPLAAWGAWDALKQLAAPEQSTRYAARVLLRSAPPDPEIAALARVALHNGTDRPLRDLVDLLRTHADDPVAELRGLLSHALGEVRAAARAHLAELHTPAPPRWEVPRGASVEELVACIASSPTVPPPEVWAIDDLRVQTVLVKSAIGERWRLLEAPTKRTP